jgi:hypothetical protein
MRIEFIGPTDPGRDAAESHVRDVYRQTYGANLRAFAPLLVSAADASGRVLATAGVRTAENGFFSGVYLDVPLEARLSALVARPVSPGSILEVVSLASVSPFPVLPLIDAIIGWGRSRGMEWGVFTATASLRRLLRRAGMTHLELGAARPERLPDPSIWGTYFASDPQVCAFSDLSAALILSPRARAC